MKKIAIIFLLVCLLFAQTQCGGGRKIENNSWEVYFSPSGGCTDAIVREIGNSKKTILVQAYSFTSSPIAKALVDAHKRGVKIEVLLDKSQRGERYTSADFLAHSGISTKIDSRHQIAHNKIMIIDSNTVITGSFNFTKSAEKSNAENLLIIKDKKMADKYSENWKNHDQHSEKYTGKGSTQPIEE